MCIVAVWGVPSLALAPISPSKGAYLGMSAPTGGGTVGCRTNKRTLLVLAGIAALAIAVRVPFFFWPLTGDEGNYAYTAYWWLRGQPLYLDYLGLEKPQGVFLSYAACQLIFGPDTWATRLWGAFWAAATCLAIYYTARRVAGARSALVASLLFALYSSAPEVDGFNVNAELFMVLPLTLGVLAIVDRKSFLAGLLVGVGMLFKVSALSAGLLLIYWLVTCSGSRSDWLRTLAGVAIPPALALLHGALTVGASAYIFNVYTFRFAIGWGYLPDPVSALATGWIRTAPVWLALGTFAIIGWIRKALAPMDLVMAWTATSLIGVAMGGEWIGHYYVQLLPPLAVLAGAGVATLFRPQRLLVPSLSLVALIVSISLIAPRYWMPPDDGAWQVYHRPGIQVAARVADYIHARTSDSDTMYVAYYQANIYHQARRKAAVPYLSRVQLLYGPAARDRLLASMTDQDPTYIVWLDQALEVPDRGTGFVHALEAGYHVETVIDGVPIYRRNQ